MMRVNTFLKELTLPGTMLFINCEMINILTLRHPIFSKRRTSQNVTKRQNLVVKKFIVKFYLVY